MSLIDSTYFINDISLDTGTYSDIAASITKYERQLIESIFDYADAQLILDEEEGAFEQAVINGDTYTISGITYKWKGLANLELESPIAYYVYYYHLRNLSSVTTNVGNVQANMENGKNISFGQKIGASWIKMQELLYELQSYLQTTYPAKNFYMINGSVNMFDL